MSRWAPFACSVTPILPPARIDALDDEDATVLIVDDTPSNVELLDAMLEADGLRTMRAFGGSEAIAAYRSRRPDLVLLDLMMPGLSGFDVLRALSAERGDPPVPIVVVTAVGDRAARLAAFELGASDFLDKPIDGQLVIRRVRTHLELSQTLRRLQRANAELTALHAMQNELTAFLVHDLKGPLAAISMNASWLATELRAGETRDAVDEVAVAASRLGTMVNQMLEIGRLESGERPAIELGEARPEALMSALVRANLRDAEQRAISLSVESPTDLRVRGDTALLERSLANLLENALRYTPPNGNVSMAAEADAHEVRMMVRNTGAPIPEGERLRIFEKYRQSGGRTGGTAGLGLYFCRRVAELHGGSIEVRSTTHWPVQFTLHLPITDARGHT
jgi:signal transduction histidine kinase